MSSSSPFRAIAREASAYAAPNDLCAIFHDQLDHLYTLALLLTADRNRAEQCFIHGLEDCLLAKPIFVDWARSWTRRAIISNAIKMVSPKPAKIRRVVRMKTQMPPASQDRSRVAAITELEPFDRFVYVISVLEGYSGHECSTLLGCTPVEIVDARARALQQLADVLNSEQAQLSLVSN